MEDWRRKHIKNYRKYKSFWGSFGEYFKVIFDDKENKEYDRKKDAAILSIGNDKLVVTKEQKDLKNLKVKISKLKFPIKTKEDFADQLEITQRTILNWKKLDSDLEKEGGKWK